MNSAPPTTVGAAQAAEAAPGIAKAHFTFSWGTCSAVKPAASGGWNRHRLSDRDSIHSSAAWSTDSGAPVERSQRFFIEAADRGAASPNGLPVTSSAIALFCASFIPVARDVIEPVVSAASTRSGVSCRSASRLGARLSGPGLS